MAEKPLHAMAEHRLVAAMWPQGMASPCEAKRAMSMEKKEAEDDAKCERTDDECDWKSEATLVLSPTEAARSPTVSEGTIDLEALRMSIACFCIVI